MARINKRTVDSLKPDEKDYFLWDDELKGFGVRVWPKGRKVYMIQYRDSSKRTRRKIIGKHGVFTPDEARDEARDLLNAVARGHNPAEEVKRKRTAPTVQELGERFMRDYVPTRCKPSTSKEYRRSLNLFIYPVLGNLKVEDVQRSDISDLHHSLREKPYQANRTLGVLSVMFNQAEVWNLRPDGSNPTRHVKKYKEEKRERFLSPEELARLSETLNTLEQEGVESLPAINCIRLLILTGCRLGEIQTLKWDYIKGNCAWLPDSKTGAKRVYLGQATLDNLASIERLADNPYVITGRLPGTHITDMQKPWRRIRKAANLEDLRIHDLRHTYAAFAVGDGISLYITGKLLGHTQAQTTARYAHLADDPMHTAANQVSDRIAEAMKNPS